MKRVILLIFLVAIFFPELASAAAAPASVPGIPALSVTSNANGSQTYTLSLQVLALMTGLTLLPAMLMMLTSFTRILIVLAIVRQAIGLPQAPSSQILVGLSLFLTLFIMAPIFTKVYNDAVQPYMAEKIELPKAFELAKQPFREFMLGQTRESDLEMFMDISGAKAVTSADQVPFLTLMPAFVTSELKTAYQIGFMIFIPFLVIDLVVASVLMAMGMMMLSPMIISLPFKIMLFVLVDGWALVMGTLAASFYTT